MHGCCFGKTQRAMHQPFDPGAPLDVLAVDGLCMGFASRVLCGIKMALVGSSSIGNCPP
jgi:hypothetical protein